MKSLYWRAVISKDAVRPRLTHHHRGEWNETKMWNVICGRVKRKNPREKRTQSPFRPLRQFSSTRTRVPTDGSRSSNPLRHGAAKSERNSFSNLSVTHLRQNSFSNPYVAFIYVTAYSPTFTLLNLRHSSFYNSSFASPTSQAFHLRHLASRPWSVLK